MLAHVYGGHLVSCSNVAAQERSVNWTRGHSKECYDNFIPAISQNTAHMHFLVGFYTVLARYIRHIHGNTFNKSWGSVAKAYIKLCTLPFSSILPPLSGMHGARTQPVLISIRMFFCFV